MEVYSPGRVNEVDDQRCYTQNEHQHYLQLGNVQFSYQKLPIRTIRFGDLKGKWG